MSTIPGLQAKQDDIAIKLSYQDPACIERVGTTLHQLFQDVSPLRDKVVVCIGTDRSTGDCLGPMIGTLLQRKFGGRGHLYGTIHEPVHAVNLKDTLQQIEERFHRPYVIAVDACLGQAASVGFIQVCRGPLKPGAGVHKDLPPVGDMHITGIVNVGGFMEYFVLQNTRLSLVMNMAEVMADCLHLALDQAKAFPA